MNEALNADLGKLDMWPVLPSLTMPTLVATGRYDINVAPSTAWKIHKAIPGSRWVVFEKSGHLPHFEEPERFVEVVHNLPDTLGEIMGVDFELMMIRANLSRRLRRPDQL